jgi:DNA-binding CsgD family transcriptional regulator
MASADRRLAARVRDAASTAPDSAAFRQRVLEAIRARVAFDAACLGGTDPATLLPTALSTIGWSDPGVYATVAELEYGTDDQPGRFETLRNRAVPIRTLREATDGRLGTSRLYTELLSPSGLRDEVRMIFRGRDGLCWGICTLSRTPGREFADDDVAALATVLADVGDGLRAVLFRDRTRALPMAPEGPAMAVVGPDNTFEMVTAAALDYFDRLGWGPPGRPVSIAPAAIAASRLRHSGQDAVAMRARTRDGEWVVIRAGRYDGERPPRRVVMTMERAQLPEIVSLAAVAHGLTRRESEVFVHTLAGESREEIGRALHITPYTVQDHLKSIYAKTGVNSRRGLVAMLVHSEYLPRLGSPVGPDGWFASATTQFPVQSRGASESQAGRQERGQNHEGDPVPASMEALT